MAKRKPAQSKARDKEVLRQSDEAERTAMEAISTLQRHLPDTMASFHLRRILTASASALCQCLQQAKESDKRGNPIYHQSIAAGLSSCAIDIANELLSFAQKNPEELAVMLETFSEWPAIVSRDPSRDIRKVLRNPEGMAAKRYAPILDHLDKSSWISHSASKRLSIFRYLAEDAVEIISPLTGWEQAYRLRGLPGLLDFSVGSKIYALESTTPSAKARLEWVFAIKYYLYLALAPEPARTQLREEWRNLRVEIFRLFEPRRESEKQLHADLCRRKPLPADGIDASSGSQWIHYPALLWEKEDQFEGNPLWVTWWETNLQHEPQALFGNSVPITAWNNPEVVKQANANHVKGAPMAAFGRSVNAVLDAFLRLLGVKNGLKQIDSRKTPIPAFGPRASRPEDASIAAKAMRAHFQNLTAKRQ